MPRQTHLDNPHLDEMGLELMFLRVQNNNDETWPEVRTKYLTTKADKFNVEPAALIHDMDIRDKEFKSSLNAFFGDDEEWIV